LIEIGKVAWAFPAIAVLGFSTVCLVFLGSVRRFVREIERANQSLTPFRNLKLNSTAWAKEEAGAFDAEAARGRRQSYLRARHIKRERRRSRLIERINRQSSAKGNN